MTTVQGYFDGASYIALERVEVKPNQKIKITILDEFMEHGEQDVRKKLAAELRGCFRQYADPKLAEKESEAWAMAMETCYKKSID